MINSQPVIFRHGTALSARERLLGDREMRRNRPGREGQHRSLAPSISYTFHSVPAAALTCDESGYLSPVEQQQQALEAARSFTRHYLAEISYHPAARLAIAIIRPVDPHRDTSHKICVDPEGSVNVMCEAFDADSVAPRRRSALWLTLGGVLATLSTLGLFLVF